MNEKYHFLGIGGIGMSALAHILLEKGSEVSGSDLRAAALQNTFNMVDKIPEGRAVVYSSAIKKNNPLFQEAEKKGALLLHRSELVGRLLKGKRGLLVGGTHGKTSTSALLSWVLSYAQMEPTFAVGGILKNFQKNGRYGKGDFFVLEADESDGSFLNYSGEGAIVTNIEEDHLDFWKEKKELVKGFKTFIDSIKNPELLLWCSDDPLLQKMNPKGISYGMAGELRLLSCKQKGGATYFSAHFKGKTYEDVELPLMGEMLALNALAVFGMGLQLGIEEKVLREAFKAFQGVKRRQEKIGEKKRVTIYDDYAHHPTEVRTLLKSFKKGVRERRLIALFQPHRYSRTRDCFEGFQEAFKDADMTIVTDIYAAGEKPIPGIEPQSLVKEALYIPKEKILALLPKLLLPGDVLVTIGAGDITEFGPKILGRLD